MNCFCLIFILQVKKLFLVLPVKSLAQDIRDKDKKVTMVNEQSLKSKLDEFIKDGDVILMQGAGSIGQMAVNLMKKCENQYEHQWRRIMSL